MGLMRSRVVNNVVVKYNFWFAFQIIKGGRYEQVLLMTYPLKKKKKLQISKGLKCSYYTSLKVCIFFVVKVSLSCLKL